MPYSADDLFGDITEEPKITAPVAGNVNPTAPVDTAPPPVAPAPVEAPRRGISADEMFGGSDNMPAKLPSYYRKPKAAAAPEEQSDFLAGLYQGGVKQNAQAVIDGWDMLGALKDSPEMQAQADAMRKSFEAWDKSGGQRQLRVPGLENIGSFGDAVDWMQGQLGVMLGSTGPSLGAGLAVGAATSPLGPEVSVPAGLVAAGGMSYLQNTPEVYRGLLDAGMKDKKAAAKWAMAAGAPIAALDVIGERLPFLRALGAGAEREVKRAIFKRIVQEAGKGSALEGSTEAAQAIIASATESLAANKDFLTKENFLEWANNFAGGAVGGGVISGTTGILPDKQKAGLNTDDKTKSNDVEGEGTEGLPAEPGKDAGGALGATVAQPPPGAEVESAEEAKVQPPGQTAADTEEDVVVEEGVAPPSDVDEDQQVALAGEEGAVGEGEAVPGADILMQRRKAVVDPSIGAALPSGSEQPVAGQRPSTDLVTQIVEAVPKAPPPAAAPAAPIEPTPLPSEPSAPPSPPVPPDALAAPPAAPTESLSPPELSPAPAEPAVAPAPPVAGPPSAPVGAPSPSPLVERMPTPEEENQGGYYEAGYFDDEGNEYQPAPAIVTPTAGISADEMFAEKPELVSEPAPVAPTVKRPKKPTVVAKPKPTGVTFFMPEEGAAVIPEEKVPAYSPREKQAEGVAASLRSHIREVLRKEHKVSPEDDPDAAVRERDVQRATEEAIAAYANEAGASQHANIRAAVEALREPILQHARSNIAAVHEKNEQEEQAERQRQTEEAAKQTVEKTEKAAVEHHEKLHEGKGTGQERARSRAAEGGKDKSQQAKAVEPYQTFKRRVRRLADALQKKGEALPQWMQDAIKEFDWRAENLKGTGAIRRAAAEKSDERIAALREQEQAETEAAAKPVLAPEEKAKAIEEAVVAAVTPKEEMTAGEAKRKAARVDHSVDDNHLANAIDDHPLKGDELPKSYEGFTAAVKEKFDAFLKQLEEKLQVPADATLDMMKSKGYNFVVAARKLVRRNADPLEMAVLRGAVEADTREQFYDGLMAGERDIFSWKAQPVVEATGKPADDLLQRMVDMGLVEPVNATTSDKHGLTNHNTGVRVEVGPENRVSLSKLLSKFTDPFGSAIRSPYFNWQRDGAGRWARGKGLASKALSDHVIQFIDKQIAKHLPGMRVYVVTNDQMQRLLGNHPGQLTYGFFSEPSVAERARGAKGVIVMNEATLADPSHMAAILRHEAIHGLTLFAVRQNVDGFGDTVTALRTALEKAKPELFDKDSPHYQYGSMNNAEFVAEALMNPAFQQQLADVYLNEADTKRIDTRYGDRGGTLWDAFIAGVMKLLRGGLFGKRGMTVLEGILRSTETTLRDDANMEFEARRLYGRARMAVSEEARQTMLAPGSPLRIDRPGDVAGEFVGAQHYGPSGDFAFSQNVLDDFQQQVNHARVDGMSTTARALRRFKTSTWLAEATRKLTGKFGIDANPFETWNSIIRQTKRLAETFRLPGNQVLKALGDFTRKNPKEAARVTDILERSDRFKVDPSVPLSHAHNRHISKTGFRDSQARAQHAALSKEYGALSPEAKKQFNSVRDMFTTRHNEQMLQAIKDHIAEAQKKNVLPSLPPGVTEEERAEWVLDGHIDNVHRVSATERDKAIFESLGPIGKELRDMSAMRRARGVYIPRSRRGKYAVKARQKAYTDANKPAGADVLPDGRLMFADDPGKRGTARRKVAAYLAKTSDTIGSVESAWFDPKTGKRSLKVEEDTENVIYVKLQRDYYQQFESRAEARQHVADLTKDPEMTDVSDVMLTATSPFEGRPGMMQSQMDRIINDATKRFEGDVNAQKNIKAAVTMAMMEANARSYMHKRKLKRKGVAGYEQGLKHDPKRLMRDIYEYNNASSNYLARQQLRTPAADARQKALDLVQQHESRHTDGSGEVLRDTHQLMDDIYNTHTDLTKKGDAMSRFSAVTRSIVTINYLFSPAYFAIQAFQPTMFTLPRISSDHGALVGHHAFVKAHRKVGGWRQLMAGAGRTASSIKAWTTGIDPNNDVPTQIIANVRKRDPAAAAMLEKGRDEGLWGLGAGVELELNEFGKSTWERALARVMHTFSVMTETIENVNRTVSMVAAFDAARARGWSEARATQYALDVVNETQGDYSDQVSPKWLQHPLGKIAFQFKKYPLLVYRSIGGAMYRTLASASSTQERKQAAKQLMWMAAYGVAFAGMAGLPGAEPLKWLVELAGALGLGDDWEGFQGGTQRMLRKLAGDNLSMALVRGAPRLLNIDLAQRLGYDALLTRNMPKSADEKDLKATLFDMFAGPAASMGVGEWNKINKAIGNPSAKTITAAVPGLPKGVRDIATAITESGEGKRNKFGREVNEPLSLGGMAVQALGFQPGERKADYEIGGAGRQRLKKEEGKQEHNAMIQRWVNADPADRAGIFKEIQAWNRGRKPAERITMATLIRSRNRRARDERKAKREREREMAD